MALQSQRMRHERMCYTGWARRYRPRDATQTGGSPPCVM
ncbi:MAG: hypothetical protein OJF49_001887 [Ktedonobacterales bacterium]|nr:MAG: hypothetical protein OJF49_001887 [Ktedonobacterales bacterium]